MYKLWYLFHVNITNFVNQNVKFWFIAHFELQEDVKMKTCAPYVKRTCILHTQKVP